MGCDIHAIAQVKTAQGWETRLRDVCETPRAYDTFAVLADVRNGHGFAGTPTGEGWPVLFEPRGLPTDLTMGYDDEDEDGDYFDSSFVLIPGQKAYWLGDYAYSYLTLAELKLIAAQFEGKNYTRVGMITVEAYQALQKDPTATPSEWCSYTSAKDWVNAEWQVPAMQALRSLTDYINELEKLRAAENVTADDIRMVFGFDS